MQNYHLLKIVRNRKTSVMQVIKSCCFFFLKLKKLIITKNWNSQFYIIKQTQFDRKKSELLNFEFIVYVNKNMCINLIVYPLCGIQNVEVTTLFDIFNL